MTFQKGKSGNPKGRPRGIIDRRNRLRSLLEPHAEPLINKVVELALNGDINALRLCLERLIPKATSNDLSIMLPNMNVNDENVAFSVSKELLLGLFGKEIDFNKIKNVVEILKCYKDNVPEVDKDHSAQRVREIALKILKSKPEAEY